MNTQISEEKGIRKEVKTNPIQVARVYAASYQKEGTLTAELKQTIATESYYPAKSVSNSFQDSIFPTKAFGFEEKNYTSSETRVAWIPVPVGTTVEQVQAAIDAKPSATIYRILSNRPILTEDQQYAIAQKLTTLDQIGDSQVVRYPLGHEMAGKLILSNGKPQYKKTFYKSEAIADMDHRTEDPADFYATASIKAELGIAATYAGTTVSQETI
jgi:hypothetical protein